MKNINLHIQKAHQNSKLEKLKKIHTYTHINQTVQRQVKKILKAREMTYGMQGMVNNSWILIRNHVIQKEVGR